MNLIDDPLLCAIDASIVALRSRPKSHWVVAYSGGKDSTAALKVILAAFRKSGLADLKLTLIYCDTGVENPILDAFVKSTITRVNAEFSATSAGFKTSILQAPIQDRFFVRIIGRGYPPPTNSFRWCTNGLRIRPVSEFIADQDPQNTVVVLGIRRSESHQRDRTLSNGPEGQWQKQREGSKEYDLFLPILNLDVAEVWDAVFWLEAPRSIDSALLQDLYRDASGECPVIKAPTAPPCASGRFGCWTCTVVRQDKSAQKLIDAGHNKLKPFLAFRDWLATIRNDSTKRWPTRRNGNPGLGPFTLEARKEILLRLNRLENFSGITVLSVDERQVIERLWELDHLPRLSFKHTGSNRLKKPAWLD
jgi:DNA sulfur modification protein DndC